MKTYSCATLRDGAEAFDVIIIEAEQPRCVGLFAVGLGGNPLRHLSLLRSLADFGCTIIAPCFDMLASAIPTKAELDERIRRIEASADTYARTDLPLVGIGHSIGTVTLLALVGGKAQTLAGENVISGSKWKFTRLALFAPPTDFFRKASALISVNVPIQIWVGAQDLITPPTQALFLKEEIKSQTTIEVRIDENAGHFTYMDETPPHVVDPHPNRSAFLASLANDAGQFLTV
jgi:pimeloyl-ACP methyl ester carboxylesterase